MKLGELDGGISVQLSEHSANQHIAVFGASGSGKSVRIKELIRNAESAGETVLVFDINGTDYRECCETINWISAVRDGIAIEFLAANAQEVEFRNGYLMYIVELLSNVYHLGSKQQIILRKGVFYAAEHEDEFESEVQAIKAGLEQQEEKNADMVENKMWRFLETSTLKKGSMDLQIGKVNVLTFEKIEPELQRVLIELILSVIWRDAQLSEERIGKLWIVLDEFQNLSLKKTSVLLQMLREARKYGIHLILATQSVIPLSNDVKAAIGQTGTQLYFRQGTEDIRRTATMIDPQKTAYWATRLKNLKVGESVAVGVFCIKGKTIDSPVIIKSEYKHGQV